MRWGAGRGMKGRGVEKLRVEFSVSTMTMRCVKSFRGEERVVFFFS